MKLYKHQKEARKFLSTRKYGLLGDVMGLGKTISTLSVVQYLFRKNKMKQVFIVVPAGIIQKWVWETIQFLGIEPYVYHGSKRDIKNIQRAKIVITSYGVLSSDVVALKRVLSENLTLVLDEVHNIKNPTAKRTKAAKLINAMRKYGLSGTPVFDNPSDVWSILDWLHPALAGKKADWEWKYIIYGPVTIPTRRGKRTIYRPIKYQRLPEMYQVLNKVMLRRTKDDCPDIPAKTNYYEPYTLDAKTEKLFLMMREYCFEKQYPITKTLTRLSQVLDGLVKTEDDVTFFRSAKQKRLEEMIDGRSGKLIVWFRFKESLRMVAESVCKHVDAPIYCMDGSMSAKEREAMWELWKKSDAGVAFATIKANGQGIDMIEARDAIFYGYEFTPALNEQAEDRIHRIGQKHKTSVYYLYAPGTIEEAVLSLFRDKAKLNKAVVDGKFNKRTLKKLYDRVYTLFGSDDPNQRSEKFQYYMRWNAL